VGSVLESRAHSRLRGVIGFGGIRIENNVLINDEGYEVLTADVPL